MPADVGKISAGNDCLPFPQVTGGHLLAPAGNLSEAFIDPVRADFFKRRDVFLSNIKQFDQCNHLLPLKSMVNLSKLILFQKSWTLHSWLFNPLSKKIHFSEKLFSIAKMIGNWLLSPLTSFTILEWKNNLKQK